ncbi:hypothetical protein PYW08_001953 [Mythimna loreyi]|uniref:Uncharacterized protein n=1 Tax=Mythimna loreyi TaxID=667449 RepID=A0ACC2R335_9NEOP|nr:hypothetical protein PYW08_001953 [Mythimna loreyi]
MKFLRIATWNINGIAPNLAEVVLFLHHNNIDILLVSETHLKDERVIKINGYNAYYSNHPDGTSHGGAAVVIKENIRQHYLLEIKHPLIQSVAVAIDDWLGTLTVAAVYCPPRHGIVEQTFTDYFHKLGCRFITGGDWNAKNTYWGSRLTTTRGRELKKAVDENSLHVLSTGEPTYWPTDPNKTPDLIDFFVIKGMSGMYTKIESCLDGSSDHTPVICTLSTTVIWKEPLETLYNKKTDWESFRDYIDKNANLSISLKTEEDVETAAVYVTNLIQKATWLSTPYLEYTEKLQDTTVEIKKMIALKRRLRRQWHASRNRRDKTALNHAQKELKQMIKENENNTLQDKLKTLSAHKADNYSLWKMTKSMKRPKEHNLPLRQPNGNWSRKSAQKAELFAEFLRDSFKPNEPDPTYSEKEIDDVLNSDQQMSLPLKLITPAEVRRAIARLSTKKAPGFDLITAEVLKQLPKKGIVLLTILFNAVLRLQCFPLVWKISIINMIAKPGKPPTEVASYRPISLLPVMSKLFEKLFLVRLHPILEEQRVVPNHQFGFRAHHGTVEQIHRVTHTIRQALEKREYCSAAFLDVQQAFDRVWHKGLLYKLKLCLPNTAYMILKSYLRDRIFRVKTGDCLSSLQQIRAGVPQGSVLAATLYTVYTADLPCADEVTIATYADDTAVLSCHKDPDTASMKLQTHLDKIGKWFRKWRIKASAAKSTHVSFTLKRGNCAPVNFNGTVLPQKTTVKYLGIHLDKKLTWREHIKAKRDQANIKLREFYWLIGRQSSLSLENKLLIYKSIIKPVWTYGIELWGSASHSNIEILQRFQNKALKILINAPWFTKNTEVHEYVEMPTVKEQIDQSCKIYKQRLKRHKNQLARALMNTDHSIFRLRRTRLASI